MGSILLLLVLVIVLYGLIFWSFLKKKNDLFVKCMMVFVMFYDYIFINLSYNFNSGIVFLLKSWQEYFFVITSFLLFSKLIIRGKVRKGRDNFFLMLILFLSIYGVIIGLASGKGMFAIFLNWRSYFLPILLFILLTKTQRLKNISISSLNRFIILLGVVIVGYAIFQSLTFNGKLSSLWFYQYFDNLDSGSIDKSFFNFLRGGKLRATSVYVSPLIYSMMVGLLFLFSFYSMLFKKDLLKKLLYFFLLLYFGYGIYLSNARIGIVMLGVGIVCGIIVYVFPRIKFSLILSIPFVSIIATFIMIIIGVIGDLSALGRLKQYLDLFMLFKPSGYGFADSKVVTFYDSWYISVLFLFGLLAVFYLYIHFSMFKEAFTAIKKATNSIPERVTMYTTFSFAFSFVYIFAFQYTIGGPALLILYLLIQVITRTGYSDYSQHTLKSIKK